MLNDLEAIDWTVVHGAYGPAGEVPGLIRALAGRDSAMVAKARSQLEGWVSHQGTTYSASPLVVPFLADLLIDRATVQRGALAWLLGEMCAYTNARTRYVGKVRAAVEAQVDRLMPLLNDPDGQVRDGVAFVLSQSPKSKRRTLPVLRERFDVESEPQVKARLLAAIQWLDKKTPLLAEALGSDQPLALRAAAAVTLARSDLPWTPAAGEAVRDAWDGGEPLEDCWWWGWGSSPLQDLIAGLGDRGTDSATMLGALLASSAERVREQAAAAAVLVARAQRQARPLLVPVLQGALADPSPKVRLDAIRALSAAGAAARPALDALAATVALSAAAASASTALGALIRLGDPRWPALTVARLCAGTDVEGTLHTLYEAKVPFQADVMGAITNADPGDWHRWGIDLLATWGPLAAPAVPQLRALLDGNMRAHALDALTAIGPAAVTALPMLRDAVNGPPVVKMSGNVRVSHLSERIALLRIGADPGPALDAARAGLAALRGRPSGGFFDLPYDDTVALLDALGEEGRPLRPDVSDVVTTRQDLIGLARALWRWSANPDEVYPTMLNVLGRAAAQMRQRAPLYSGIPVIELVAELGDPRLTPLLRPFLADTTGRTRVPAARAIWRLAGDADGLIRPLLNEVTARPPGQRWSEALDLLAEIGPAATDALADLHVVVEQPRCPFVSGYGSNHDRWLGHHDDQFLGAVRATITAISASP